MQEQQDTDNGIQLGERPVRPWLAPAGLVPALGILLLLVLPGMDWGLPSELRNRLTLGDDPENWRAPELSEEEAEDPWAAYPNFLEGGPERTGTYPRSAFNPIRSYHPDEYAILKSLSGMNPRELDFHPGFFGWPACQIYVVGSALKVAEKVGLVALKPDMDFYFRHPEEMARLYLVGRCVTLLFAVGCVAALWYAATRLFGPLGGGLAAMIFAGTPLIVVNSRWLTADMPMLFWMTVSFACAVHVLRGGGRTWAVAAGVFIGLAAGTRYQGALSALPVFLAYLLREQGERRLSFRRRFTSALRCGDLWLAAACSIGAFLVVNPYILLNPVQFWSEFTGELSGSRSPGSWIANTLLIGATGLGPLLGMATLGAAMMAIAQRDKQAIFVLAGFGLPCLLLWFNRPVMARYYLPGVLVCPLLIGWAGSVLHRKGCESGRRPARLAVPALVAVVLAATVLQSLAYCRLFTNPEMDTRTQAGKWIAENIPTGASIGTVSIPWQFELPPVDVRKFNILVKDPDGGLVAPMPEYFVSSDLQLPPLAIRGPLSDVEYRFWVDVFSDRGEYRVVKRVEAWPPGMRGLLRFGPHDMRYPNPVIVVSGLREAPVEASPPLQ